MPSHHPDNERIRRAYFIYLREAKGMSEASSAWIVNASDLTIRPPIIEQIYTALKSN